MSGEEEREIRVGVDGRALEAALLVPERPAGLVALASGARRGTEDGAAARVLRAMGFATLRADLAGPGEAPDAETLAERLAAAIDEARQDALLAALSVGCMGAGDAAALALETAARRKYVRAVACRGGRPDGARLALRLVRVPTLLLVAHDNAAELQAARAALARLRGVKRLDVARAAETAQLAGDWFERHLPRPAAGDG